MSVVSSTAGDVLAPRIARASRHLEHTLLYLRFHDIGDGHETELRRSLERVTARLWGPVTITRVGDGEYALFLECWSVNRSLQLAGLLGTAVSRGFKRLGRDVWMDAGTVAVRGDADAAQLLARAARACAPHPTGDTARSGGRVTAS